MATSNKSSVSSARSSKTSASTANVARARAKAEAAKVRASYASQEPKLKMEKAAREAERITRDAQNQVEATRIDTELEVLTLHREADAAMVEAQVWEDAAEIHGVMDNVKSESEKLRLQRVCSSHQGPRSKWRNSTHTTELRFILGDHVRHVHLCDINHYQTIYSTWSPLYCQQCFRSPGSAGACHDPGKSPSQGTNL